MLTNCIKLIFMHFMTRYYYYNFLVILYWAFLKCFNVPVKDLNTSQPIDD